MRITKTLNDSVLNVSGVDAGGWTRGLLYPGRAALCSWPTMTQWTARRSRPCLHYVCAHAVIAFRTIPEASYRVRRLRAVFETRVQGLGFVFSS